MSSQIPELSLTSGDVQLGQGGVRLKNDSGAMSVRNSADSDYVYLRCKAPVAASDAVNLTYLQANYSAGSTTTQYRMLYATGANGFTESSSIVTDASGNLSVAGDVTADGEVLSTKQRVDNENLGVVSQAAIPGFAWKSTKKRFSMLCNYYNGETLSLFGSSADASNPTTNIMNWTNTGNVLIGTTSQYASEKLGVNGDIYGNGNATFAGDVKVEDGTMTIKETTTPTAETNYGKVYTKSDNKLYFQDGAGTEHEISFV